MPSRTSCSRYGLRLALLAASLGAAAMRSSAQPPTPGTEAPEALARRVLAERARLIHLALGWDEDRRLLAAVHLSERPLPDAAPADLRLQDQAALADLALHSPDRDVRAVIEPLVVEPSEVARLALVSPHPDTAIAAVKRITPRDTLDRILTRAQSPEARAAVVAKVDDTALWERLAQSADHSLVRKAAVLRIEDEDLLARIARSDDSTDVRGAACSRVRDSGRLALLAREAGAADVRAAAAKQLADSIFAQCASDWRRDLRGERSGDLLLLKQVERKDRDWAVRRAASDGLEKIDRLVEDGLHQARLAEQVGSASSERRALVALRLLSKVEVLEQIAASDPREAVQLAARKRIDALQKRAAQTPRARRARRKARRDAILESADGRSLLRRRYPRLALGGALLWGRQDLRFTDRLSAKGSKTLEQPGLTTTLTWDGTLDVAYAQAAAARPQGGGLEGVIWLKPRWGVSFALQDHYTPLDAQVTEVLRAEYTATARFFTPPSVHREQDQATSSGRVSRLPGHETSLHLALTRRIPLAAPLDLEVSLGPSLVNVSERLVRQWGLASDRTRGGHSFLSRSRMAVGLNVGAGAIVDVSGPLAAVAHLRYTYSPRLTLHGLEPDLFSSLVGYFAWTSLSVPVQSEADPVRTGGVTLTLGLRWTFK